MQGDVIAGRYRLLEPLGHGAMSSVWLAEDPELARRVAVKLLAPTADRARFEREARAVAAVSHPNIVGLYDYGESDGKPFMVLECLPGGTLEERLARGTALSDGETRAIATDVAAGLAAAHARGLVHRDLKPGNILFDSEGRAKIADFGIARMGGAGTLTEAGTVLGTAAYISPEQAAGLPATAASDVYSFGVLLFRMLTGRLPFSAEDAMELVRMNRDELPPTVASVRRDAPPHLAWTADAALAKDPARRPADGAALLTALRDESAAAAALADTAATQVLAAPRPAPRRRRAAGILLPALVLAAVLLAGGAALALALTGGGSSGGSSLPDGSPSLSLPKVPTVSSSSSSGAADTQQTTAAPPTTTSPPTTTRPAATTSARTTTPSTTRAAPTTTAATTAGHTTTYTPPPTTTYTYTEPTTTDTTYTDTTTTSSYETTPATTTGP